VRLQRYFPSFQACERVTCDLCLREGPGVEVTQHGLVNDLDVEELCICSDCIKLLDDERPPRQ
jgi:hypothetical protein